MAPVKNNREALRQNIAGIHEAVALFTGVEQFNLSDPEADILTNATANLADRLGWDITGGGEGNVYVAAAMFALAVYRIEAPRVAFFVASQRARNVTPLASSTTAEARAGGSNRSGRMDFSEDIANSVNGNAGNDGNGSIQYN